MKKRFKLRKIILPDDLYHKKVNMIKIARSLTGLGLKEAKALVDDCDDMTTTQEFESHPDIDWDMIDFSIIENSGYELIEVSDRVDSIYSRYQEGDNLDDDEMLKLHYAMTRAGDAMLELGPTFALAFREARKVQQETANFLNNREVAIDE